MLPGARSTASAREKGQHLLAGNVASRCIDKHRAVRVPVVRDPDLRSDGGNGPLKVGKVRLGRFGKVPGERAVHVSVQRREATAETAEQGGARRHRRSVAAVEDDREAASSDPRSIDLSQDPFDVSASPSRVMGDFAHPSVIDER